MTLPSEAQVKMTLLSHGSIGVLRSKVDTNDGVVTLAGQSPQGRRKGFGPKLGDDVYGVKSVVSNMTIGEPKNN